MALLLLNYSQNNKSLQWFLSVSLLLLSLHRAFSQISMVLQVTLPRTAEHTHSRCSLFFYNSSEPLLLPGLLLLQLCTSKLDTSHGLQLSLLTSSPPVKILAIFMANGHHFPDGHCADCVGDT